MTCVARTSSNAKQEQPPLSFAEIKEKVSYVFDRILVEQFENFDRLLDVSCCVARFGGETTGLPMPVFSAPVVTAFRMPYRLHSFGEIVDDSVGPCVLPLKLGKDISPARTYKERLRPGLAPRQNVDHAITDHIRPAKLDLPFARGLKKQARFGLPALAREPVGIDLPFGMMQAVIHRVEVPSRLAYEPIHFFVHRLQEFRRELPLGNSGLVGNNEHEQPCLIQFCDCFAGARRESELIRVSGGIDRSEFRVIRVGIDHAIPVKEYGFARHRLFSEITDFRGATASRDVAKQANGAQENESGNAPSEDWLAGGVTSVLPQPFVVCQPLVSRKDIENHFAAFKLEAEIQLSEPRLAHGVAQTALVIFAVEHQEPAATSARNLSANRAAAARQFIPGIDLRIRDTVREPLLGLPMHIHQLSEAAQVSLYDFASDFDTDVLDLLQVFHDVAVFLSRRLILA